MKAGLLFSLFFTFACSHTQTILNREISSEKNQYSISNEAALKRIKELKAENLSDSECYADPETKIYLNNIKSSSTGNFKDLRNQINVEKLENDNVTEYYFCRLLCNVNNQYAAFWTTLTDSPSRHNDDNAFICQGVTMEMQTIQGTTLSTMAPKVHKLNLFNFASLYPRLQEINYQLNSETKDRLDFIMNENLKSIAKAYLNTTYPPMVEAGKVLDIFAYRKKGYQALLDQYIMTIRNSKGFLKSNGSKDYFVMLNLTQFGSHLIYKK